MALMKAGLVGFSGSGKSTVFQWLTGAKPDPAKALHGQTGNAKVPDPRLDWLSQKFNPKKTTAASIDFLDTPGLLASERQDNPRRLGILRESHGLIVVLNGFNEEDLAGQLTRFREEVLFADLEIISNRIRKVEDNLKKPRPVKQKELDQLELDLLKKIAAALEAGQSPSTLGLKDDEEKSIRSFQLLTLKPEVALVNQGEELLGKPLPENLLALSPGAMRAPAKLEMELAELSEEDRQAFMADLGLSGMVRDEVMRGIFSGLDQLVFFTVGEDECRAWPMPKGADAVVGASQIHTDLAKGFVRAEVVSYADFQRVGSLKEAKTHGVYRLEGKTYIVHDGDIMHILSST
ncbi:MAG: redox-regulated ATPase YchF [Gemmataceae bacterium]|nr:redox-regulated ATPase YchF [Gemmataceae bacterium]